MKARSGKQWRGQEYSQSQFKTGEMSTSHLAFTLKGIHRMGKEFHPYSEFGDQRDFTFGRRLAFYRTRAGQSQEDAAKSLDVKSQTVSSWECGRRRPSVRQLKKFILLFVIAGEVEELKQRVLLFVNGEPSDLSKVLEKIKEVKTFWESPSPRHHHVLFPYEWLAAVLGIPKIMLRDVMTSLGIKLRYYRHRMRMLLAEVGSELGVSTQAVGYWEQDQFVLEVQNLQKFCELCVHKGVFVNVVEEVNYLFYLAYFEHSEVNQAWLAGLLGQELPPQE